MDKVIIHKVTTRPNYLKDHNLKYLEFKALCPNRLGKLREIIESLPEGKQRATATEIITWLHESFTEVLKDYDGLQEGSELRNTLEDAIQWIQAKDREIAIYENLLKQKVKTK